MDTMEKPIVAAVNEAIRKSQEMMTEEMKKMCSPGMRRRRSNRKVSVEVLPRNEAEKKFSASLPNVSGMGPSSYNDIGCAVISRNSECATRQMTFDSNAVVYDYVTEEAIPSEKAFFVLKSDVKTPAGYGIVAFKDKMQADKFSAEHGKGKVVRWFELVDEKLQ
jgi:hypothetical protein